MAVSPSRSPSRDVNPFRMPTPPPPPAVTLPALDSIFTPRKSFRRKPPSAAAGDLLTTQSTVVVNPLASPAGRFPSSARHSRGAGASQVSRHERSVLGSSTRTMLERSVATSASVNQKGQAPVHVSSSRIAAPHAAQHAPPESSVFTAPMVPSVCFPGRFYYGGKYYVPPRTIGLERMLSLEFHKYTSEEGSPRHRGSPVGQLGLTFSRSNAKLH